MSLDNFPLFTVLHCQEATTAHCIFVLIGCPSNTAWFLEEVNMYHFAPAQAVISGGPMQNGPLILRHINTNMDWSHKTHHISVSCSFHLSCKVLEMLWKWIIQTSGDIAHNYKWKMYCILFIYCLFPLSSLICTAWAYAKVLLKPLLNFPGILIRHNSCSIEASLI